LIVAGSSAACSAASGASSRATKERMCFIVVITLRVMLRLFIVLPHAEREDYYAACHCKPSARHKKILAALSG